MKARRWKRLYGASVSFTCPYCLKTFPLTEGTRDHVIPKSRGGSSDPKNIVLSCAECNQKKGSLTDKEFAEWKRLEFIRNGGLAR